MLVRRFALFPGIMTIAAALPTTANAEPGEVDLVTAGYASGQAVGGNSFFMQESLSADGRFVLFRSDSGDVVPNDGNGRADLFVRDRQTGHTVRVNVSTSGAVANQDSGSAAISADGRYVVFDSDATNLVPSDTNGATDIFLRDVQAGTTTRVNVSSTGEQANGMSGAPTVSGDGRYVAFDSLASNLVHNVHRGVFVRDRLNSRTTYIEGSAYGYCNRPRISGNGRFVALECPWRMRQVIGPGHASFHGFLYDRESGAVQWVTQNTGRLTHISDISYDGRYVAFDSHPGEMQQAYLWDRELQREEMVSLSLKDQPGNLHSWGPTVSDDGRYVAFESWASNLVPDDPNRQGADIFVRDRLLGTTEKASAGTQVTPFQRSFLSPNGRVVLFATDQRLKAIDHYDALFDLYVRELGPRLELSPASLNFGGVDVNSTSAAKTVQVRNAGTVRIPIKWIGISGGDSGQFEASRDCPGVLAAGRTCTASVVFRPTSTGSKSSRLVVSTDASEPPLVNRTPVNGTGL